MPRLTAEAIAPPAPWANLAAISIGWLTDTPQSSVGQCQPAGCQRPGSSHQDPSFTLHRERIVTVTLFLLREP